jgi:hypothetical protein
MIELLRFALFVRLRLTLGFCSMPKLVELDGLVSIQNPTYLVV